MAREAKVVGSDASVHPKTVEKAGQAKPPKRRARAPSRRRGGKVEVRQMHPALKMAHDLGIDPGRIEITAQPPLWGCIIHNSKRRP